MARAGAVWLDVLPSLAGWNTAVRSQASVSLAGVGTKAGEGYGKGLLGGMRAVLSGMRGEVAGQAQAASAAAAASVDMAAAKVSAARKREADAAGSVRVAEAKLSELRAKEGTSASTLAGAEERLAKAQRSQQLAAEHTATADKELATAQKTAADATAAASEKTSLFSKASGAVSTGAGKMTSKMGGVAKAALGMAGVFAVMDVAKVGVESIKAAGDFQKSTSVLVTAAGESESNLKKIRAGILQISDTTGTTTAQLSEGMYEIEKAGIHGAGGLKVLSAAAEGAKEENADLGIVTNAMTSIMNSYHIPVSKSVQVMNALKTAAANSKTTMQDFAGSLSTVLPIAAANHISFANVAGALGTLTSHGTSADEATQELAFSIRSLSAPNAVAIKEMGQLGISSQNVQMNLGKRGLLGSVQMLSEAVLKQMGPSGKVLLNTFYQSTSAGKAAAEMFDKLGPAAQKVAKEYADGKTTYKQFYTDMKQLTPEARNQAMQWATLKNKSTGFNDAIKQGLPGTQTYSEAMKKMMGGSTGLNTALMLLGGNQQKTKDRTDAVARSMADGRKSVEGWDKTSQLASTQQEKMSMSLKNAGVQIGTAMLPALSKLAGWIAKIVPQLLKFVSVNWSWLKPVALGILGLVTATWLFNAALAANPVTLVVLGIIALGVALIVAYKNVKTFRDIVNEAWKILKTGTVDVIDFMTKDFIPFFTTKIPDAFHATVKWIGNAWDEVKSLLKTWGPVALALLVPFIGIPLLIYTHFAQIRGWLSGVWSRVRGDIRGFTFGAVSDMMALPDRIAGLGGRMWSAGAHLISQMLAGIRGALSSAGSFASGIGWDIANSIISAINWGLHLPIVLPRINTHIPGVGTIGGETLMPAIPHLAAGGVTDGATLAMIGDNRSGHELVAPLDSPKTVRLLAKALGEALGTNGRQGPPVNITVNNPVDRPTVEQIVDGLDRRQMQLVAMGVL